MFSGQAFLDVEVPVAAGTKTGHRVAGHRKTPCGRQRRLESEILIVVARTGAGLPVTVFNAANTAPLGIQAMLNAGSYDVGPKGERIEDPAEWTEEKFVERAKTLHKQESPEGDFED